MRSARQATGARRLALLVLVLAVSLLSAAPAGQHPAVGVESGPGSTARLPAEARASISRLLGQDDPAYRVIEAGTGLRATNRGQHLHLRFTHEGVRVRAGKSRLGLSLSGFGYRGAVRAVPPARPRAVANRVEYSRGGLSEWYANGPLGLEQGFTLRAAPAPARAGTLELALALSGNLTASPDGSRHGVTFAGSSLRYAGLSATDATGRRLPAAVEVRGRNLLLDVDASGARYPISIDPFIQQARLTPSDGAARDGFGTSVAISDDTIVAGAPQNAAGAGARGAVYVFVKPASGWANATQSAKLTASDGAATTRLGFSVSISGDTIAAGAIFANVGSNIRQGAAYVFVKPASGWTNAAENAKLTASDGAAGDLLGVSIALAGDTIVAGASQAKIDANPTQGAAYVFTKPTGGWSGSLTESAKLTASDGATTDTLGQSVSVSGDTIVAGADDAGAAYVFVKPASGWSGRLTESAKLAASDGNASNGLGFSTAITGDTVVAGAYFAGVGSDTWRGAAYVFVKPDSGWSGNLTQRAKLIASDGKAYDMLGYSIAVAGDTVVVGAPHRLFGDPVNPGAVYAFVKPASGWSGTLTESAKLTASDAAQSDFFGISVALAGNFGVGGSARDNVNTPSPGAAYAFDAPLTPPDAPIAVNATAADASAMITWTPPATSGGSPITRYLVTPFEGSAAQPSATVGNVTTATVGGLSNGSTYTFKVSAVNTVGTGPQSAASNLVTPRALRLQTIAFAKISGRSVGDADFAVTATASSGLPVSFTARGACTVSGRIVHVTGAGRCTVTASQPGNAEYKAAVSVSRSFSIITRVRCKVPRLVGKTALAARRMLAKGHCRSGKVRHAYSKKIGKGRVISQSRRAGRVLRNRSRVGFVVSRGRRR